MGGSVYKPEISFFTTGMSGDKELESKTSKSRTKPVKAMDRRQKPVAYGIRICPDSPNTYEKEHPFNHCH
jgi:hypothetical protein